jgi:hypothetical protein
MSGTVDTELVKQIEKFLRHPVYFRDLLAAFRDQPYRAILRAWSEVRTSHALERDERGRYWLKS